MRRMCPNKWRYHMQFFVGLDHPYDAQFFKRAFISVHALKRRKGDFQANDWILDSGAFSTIKLHGGYPDPPENYAQQIIRWSRCGNLLAAVSQDYMCEPVMLARTGLTVRDHQRLTIERYDRLVACNTGVYIMPVLQGYEPEEYVDHIRQYGDRLKPGMWVGVGSVCKRNAQPCLVFEVLAAVKLERPDLDLHGFGLKKTALQHGAIRGLLCTGDSMSWSYAARREGRDQHDIDEARRFVQAIEDENLIRSPFELC